MARKASQSSAWITLLAGLGIGSIVSGVLSWWSTKAVTISNHRQNWVNALRDDLVTYLKHIDVVHQLVRAVDSGHDATDELSEARNSAMFVYRRILLRLNITEPLHVELGEYLEGLLIVSGQVADADKVARSKNGENSSQE